MSRLFPPVRPGCVRIWTDHTGRFYEDVPIEDLEGMRNDPLYRLLAEEVQKELNKEIVRIIDESKLEESK